MRQIARISSTWVVGALVIALSTPAVPASRASNSRPGGSGERATPTSSSEGSARASRAGRPSGGDVQTAGGRASWRHGGGRHSGGGYYYRDPWPYLGLYGWYGWYGWYGPAWAAYPDPRYRVVVQDRRDVPAWIETDVRPAKARVILDGTEVGLAKDYNGTWDRLTVAPGRHRLEFRRDGYATLRVDVDLEPGRAIRIVRRLSKGEGEDPTSVILPPPEDAPTAAPERAPRRDERRAEAPLARGLLRLDVLPEDAAVYLDGEYLARADELARMHGALPVAIGAHRVEVVRPGFESRTIEVEVEEDRPARVVVRLEAL